MSSAWVNDQNAALLTDLYELTMLESYFREGMNGTAIFDLFIRRLPPTRNHLIACGLEDVLHYLETFSFSTEALDYLRSLDKFSEPFLASLKDFRFTGDVFAVAEGTIVFPNEPIIEIRAPLPQGQLVETFVINQIHLATMAASKASRVVSAAGGRPVVDFGLRRMHGSDAGMKQARAFYIAGVDATSNVLAGQVYGIPIAGTMAHSYIQSFDDELAAFRSFVRSYPEAVLLVDTYDTLNGVQLVIGLAQELGSAFRVSGVRLDSGDLLSLSWKTRTLLDNAGLRELKIFASSDLDEFEIDRLLKAGAPIDGFGVGSRMGTSSDWPHLDAAYKLVGYAGRPRMKSSEHKSSLPGSKQVFRKTRDGRLLGDVIGLAHENLEGTRLLTKVMEDGRRLQPAEDLEKCRARCREQIESLPPPLMEVRTATPAYLVEISEELIRARERFLARQLR
jgi:nicotinate phosphoribosyltransferase